MKKINGFNKVPTYSDTQKLPVGGYVLKIMNVEYKEYSQGDVIILSFDIADGEYRNFYQSEFNSNTREDKHWKGTYRMWVPKDDGSERDNWTMRRFKTDIVSFEESNSGYHWDWDENTLKGKLVGGIFNNKEYQLDDGRKGFFTNCHHLTSVDKIRSGNFKIPADTNLKGSSSRPVSVTSDDSDFMNIPDGAADDGIPFN